MLTQTALNYDVEVDENGQVELTGPFPVDKIYMISTSIVVKTFGRVKEEVLENIREGL